MKLEVARACLHDALRVFAQIPALQTPHFALPSDGGESFATLVPEAQRCEFTGGREHLVVLGAPPFDGHGATAVEFFNDACKKADTVALVTPVIFSKHAIHKKLAPEYRLVFAKPLGRDALAPTAGAVPSANIALPPNMEFQIWTRCHARGLRNLRQFQPAPYQHSRFALRLYDNTRAALTMFKKPFDFAVPCWGFQNYTRRETATAACETSKPWMLFKTTHAPTRRNLLALDFHRLAYHATTGVPGFRKNDVVTAYIETYGRDTF